MQYFVIFYPLIGLLFFVRFRKMFLDEPGTRTDFFVYGVANFVAWPLFLIGIIFDRIGIK